MQRIDLHASTILQDGDSNIEGRRFFEGLTIGCLLEFPYTSTLDGVKVMLEVAKL